MEGVGDVGAGALSLLVDLGDVDLDGCVVLGGYEAVGGGALAGDVKVDNLALEKADKVRRQSLRSRDWPEGKRNALDRSA